MQKWLEAALERLDPEDEDELNYPVHCDGKSGYLVLSKKKLIFVEETGFIHKTDKISLDAPYEHIDKITVDANTLIIIIDGRTHGITSTFPISTIENAVQEFRESALSPAVTIHA